MTIARPRRAARPAARADLPEGFVPRAFFHERRATLVLAREDGRSRPPLLLDESGCRITGTAGGRPFAIVLDDPGAAGVGSVARRAAEAMEGSAFDPHGTIDRWTAPIQAAFERWEAELAAPGAAVLAVRMEAAVAAAEIAAGPLHEGAAPAARDGRSFVEGRLVITVGGPRPITVETTRWADASSPPPVDLWARAALATLRHGKERIEALPVPTMEAPALFAPAAAGVLLHEICGHLLEADLVVSGASPFAAVIGEAIAPQGITLADDPQLPGGRVRLRADDEGEPARTNVVIESGILRAYLSDRSTASATGGSSSGNARRDSYRHPALPRMTNLVLSPGADDPADLLRGIGRGLLVEALGRGQVDPRRGEFRLEVTSGRLIEDGAPGRPVTSAFIVGSCRGLLKAIDGVGPDVNPDPGAGVCIKDDQIVPVGQAAPTVRVSRVRILPGVGG